MCVCVCVSAHILAHDDWGGGKLACAHGGSRMSISQTPPPLLARRDGAMTTGLHSPPVHPLPPTVVVFMSGLFRLHLNSSPELNSIIGRGRHLRGTGRNKKTVSGDHSWVLSQFKVYRQHHRNSTEKFNLSATSLTC